MQIGILKFAFLKFITIMLDAIRSPEHWILAQIYITAGNPFLCKQQAIHVVIYFWWPKFKKSLSNYRRSNSYKKTKTVVLSNLISLGYCICTKRLLRKYVWRMILPFLSEPLQFVTTKETVYTFQVF